MSDTAIFCLSLALILVALVWLITATQRRADRLALAPTPPLGPDTTGQPAPCGPLGRVRQVFRRWSWLLLFALGLGLYPVQIYWQVRYAASQVANSDAATAATAEAAKVVDPALVFSKMSIALGVFCLINLLAWCALNMVLPVLADWAKGDYSTADKVATLGLETPVVGFKRTFLSLSGSQRILVYFLGFGLQLLAAGLGVYSAFNIQ